MQIENYHFCSHVYASQFRNELILLDTKRDKYTICSEQLSKMLLELVGETGSRGAFSSHAYQQTLNDEAGIKGLINEGFIEKTNTPYPYYIDQKIESHGVSNVDWRLPLNTNKFKLDEQVLQALIILVKVNFYMQFRGFYRTIQFIKKSRNSESNYIIPKSEELEVLVSILNKACLIYPMRTKCLRWAMTFVLLALKKKWKCNLEIGVQNYPFMAHAWVECDGKVIMDSEDLRKGLAIILNEPFRRFKI